MSHSAERASHAGEGASHSAIHNFGEAVTSNSPLSRWKKGLGGEGAGALTPQLSPKVEGETIGKRFAPRAFLNPLTLRGGRCPPASGSGVGIVARSNRELMVLVSSNDKLEIVGCGSVSKVQLNSRTYRAHQDSRAS